MKYILVREEEQVNLLGIWILVIIIVAVIGLLSKEPPERINHSFHHQQLKTQYITIGGTSTTKVSENSE
nr:MAG: hypothetical protein 4 [Betanecrovirus sp.]